MNLTAGNLTWSPTFADGGEHDVTLRADDGQGGTALQRFSVRVVAPAGGNLPPRITSTPPLQAEVGQAYSYQVAAVDSEGDGIAYSLAYGPPGAAIDPLSGLLSWTPAAGQAGPQLLGVQATDGVGNAIQSFTVAVGQTSAALPAVPLDRDADGFDETEDCDDTNDSVNPGMPEIPGNGIDDDCNPATPDRITGDTLQCSVVTARRSYSNGTQIQLTMTARNTSEALAITGLEGQMTIRLVGSTELITRGLTLTTLPPRGLLRSSVSFDSRGLADGSYTAVLALGPVPAIQCDAQTTFAIGEPQRLYLPILTNNLRQEEIYLPLLYR
jgi:hypothetical protein